LFGDVADHQLQAPAADLDRIGHGREYRAASAPAANGGERRR
jgi:hypothetical protein